MTPARVVNFIPAGGFTHIIPVDRHYPVAGRQHGGNTLAAAAGGHGIDHHGIEVVMGDGSAGGLVNKIVDPFPLPQHRIQAFAFFDGLIRSGGIDFKGSFAIHPVVSAA